MQTFVLIRNANFNIKELAVGIAAMDMENANFCSKRSVISQENAFGIRPKYPAHNGNPINNNKD